MMSNEPGHSDLYHPDLLAFAREPLHWRKEHQAQYIIKAWNSVCGDKFEIRCDADLIIEDISFFGYGCLVSKASIELLCTMLAGRDIASARQIVEGHLNALQGVAQLDKMDKRFAPFLVAQKFPGRIQCVTLGWEAISRSDLLNNGFIKAE
jgi:nitrogen fixation NifU-like protein